MTDNDIEAYRFAMSQPGAITSALNYYRNIDGFLVDHDWMKEGQSRITSPTLVVWVGMVAREIGWADSLLISISCCSIC